MISVIFAPEFDLVDIILEGLSVFAYIFILLMAFYANKRNPIFRSKGFPVLIFGIGFGLIAAVMDFYTEFFWIENNYDLFKSVMVSFQIASLVFFGIAMYLVFRFTTFMLGEDSES
ncbi:MAG: hypothetical protein ACTSRK_15500 [Promethearchaeota archaeon]